MKQLKVISITLFVCMMFFSSCKTPSKIVYLQDIQPDITIALQEVKT